MGAKIPRWRRIQSFGEVIRFLALLKKGSVFTGPFFILFFSSVAWSQNYETLVEDFYFNTSSRIVLDQDSIQRSKAPDIATLLLTQSNVSVLSTPFQSTSLSIRGGDSGHVLILLDGVPFYDPSTIQRTGALSLIDIRSVKKIEILKGSQSVLYGGQALSGVIKIDTISSEDKNSVFAEFGTHEAIAAGAEASYKAWTARTYGKKRQSDSPAKNSAKTYSFEQTHADLIHKNNLGFLKLSYLKHKAYSPSSDTNFQIIDVKNFKLQNEAASISGVLGYLSFGLQQNIRRYDFPDLPLDEDYKSNFHFLRLDKTLIDSQKWKVDAGVSYTYEDFLYKDLGIRQAKRFQEHQSVFIKSSYQASTDWTYSIGARNENSFQAFHAGASFKKTRFEVASGYKNPSLYQLYSPYGNKNLQGEKALQYSLIQDWEMISITAFWSEYKDLISTTGNFPNIIYSNINKSRTRGLEGTVHLPVDQNDKVTITTGYQEPYNLTSRQWLPRRPLVNANLRYHYIRGKAQGQFEGVWVGERRDVGPQGIAKLDSYGLIHFTYLYELVSKDSVYVRVHNLTDARNEETYGYFSEGRSAIMGWSRQW